MSFDASDHPSMQLDGVLSTYLIMSVGIQCILEVLRIRCAVMGRRALLCVATVLRRIDTASLHSSLIVKIVYPK